MILKLLSLQTKSTKSKPPAQVQQWLKKIYETIKQWISLSSTKIKKYIAELKQAINNQSITKRQLLSQIGTIQHIWHQFINH